MGCDPVVEGAQLYNNTANYVDQGGNKRPGTFAIYLEAWYGDVFEFLDRKMLRLTKTDA